MHALISQLKGLGKVANSSDRPGAIAQQLLPVPAADLSPAELPARGGDTVRRPLIQLVEYVDRSGVMAGFLAEAAAAWPQSEPIRTVSAAFSAWDAAYGR